MRASRRDRQGDTPRRGASRASQPLTDAERIAAVAAEADVPVEGLLREVADFRLALETDMIIAAAAVEAENPELLADMVDGERRELAVFHDRLMERLADAAADDELSRRRAEHRPRPRRFSQVVLTAAAALALFGVARTALNPQDVATTPVAAMQEADQQYRDLSSAVTSDSPVAVQQAAQQLHDTLEQLIADHANDPAVAHRAAQLLQAEINLLRHSDPHGASQVLAQARSLVSLLERNASPKVRDAVKPVLDAAAAEETKRPSPSASPKPKPTKSPSPKAEPSESASPSNPLQAP